MALTAPQIRQAWRSLLDGDATLAALVKLDFAVTPDGSDIVWQLNAAGFARAA